MLVSGLVEMYLKHLTINGFKSFAKKGELEFLSPITAIVGPNGSGKSNVAESFRFVLGEQSHTKMRGRKGEDLIWGGSDQISRGNRASVAIALDNKSRIFPIDFDEITLERVVHRDGQNEYLINGSQVRLKDVQEILAAANIGPSGHHIISQGEADRILAASPRERREMIEDALGLKVYQFKKNESEKKLIKTKVNITQVEGLRREVGPHLRFLEKQVKKMEHSVKLRHELQDTYAEYLKREDLYLNHQQDKLTKEAKPLRQRLEELSEALNTAKTTLEANKNDERQSELLEAERGFRQVRETRQNLLREIGTVEGQLSLLDRRIKTAEERAVRQENLSVPYSELEKIVAVSEREVEKAIKLEDVSTLRRALMDLARTWRQFLNNSVQDSPNSSAREDENEKQLLEQKKRELDNEAEKLTHEEGSAETRYNEIRQAIEADQSKSHEAEKAVFKIVNERQEVERSLSQIEYALTAVERDREEFKRELQEAVVLLGRNANQYLDFPVPADSLTEDRERQRDRRRHLEKMKIRLEELGGANEDIEKEYKNVKERDDFLVREIADLNASVEKLEQLIKELDHQLNERFSVGIEKIAAEFNRFFNLMFGGGMAGLNEVKLKKRKRTTNEDLDLDEDPEDESDTLTESGIEVELKLPNKRVKGLDMLSGGERALTSIALIFAMSQVNPPLFVILDETDAALDEANSRRYGDMIEALAKKSQLILITHNRETMSRAGILYGVTMTGDGTSKLLSVKLEEAVQNAK